MARFAWLSLGSFWEWHRPLPCFRFAGLSKPTGAPFVSSDGQVSAYDRHAFRRSTAS